MGGRPLHITPRISLDPGEDCGLGDERRPETLVTTGLNRGDQGAEGALGGRGREDAGVGGWGVVVGRPAFGGRGQPPGQRCGMRSSPEGQK